MTTTNTVSARALQKRINRKLAQRDEHLCKSRAFYDEGRGPIFDQNTGEYFTFDIGTNFLVADHVDIEALGRELGVLGDGETVEDQNSPAGQEDNDA